MESRIKGRVLAIIVAGAMIVSTSTVVAATTKPTSKPTVKVTPRATPKPSVKAKPKVTKKAVPRKTVAKRAPAKKVVYQRKALRVSSSPSPKWPAGLKQNPPGSEIYYKIPKPQDLLGALSATAALTKQIVPCTNFACGVVTVASTNGCTWWEINSTVSGPLSATDSTMVPYGTLHTTAKGTTKKQLTTILLVSTQPLKTKVSVGGINISCHHGPTTEKVPANVYTLNAPVPTDSPTDSPTPNTN